MYSTISYKQHFFYILLLKKTIDKKINLNLNIFIKSSLNFFKLLQNLEKLIQLKSLNNNISYLLFLYILKSYFTTNTFSCLKENKLNNLKKFKLLLINNQKFKLKKNTIRVLKNKQIRQYKNNKFIKNNFSLLIKNKNKYYILNKNFNFLIFKLWKKRVLFTKPKKKHLYNKLKNRSYLRKYNLNITNFNKKFKVSNKSYNNNIYLFKKLVLKKKQIYSFIFLLKKTATFYIFIYSNKKNIKVDNYISNDIYSKKNSYLKFIKKITNRKVLNKQFNKIYNSINSQISFIKNKLNFIILNKFKIYKNNIIKKNHVFITSLPIFKKKVYILTLSWLKKYTISKFKNWIKKKKEWKNKDYNLLNLLLKQIGIVWGTNYTVSSFINKVKNSKESDISKLFDRFYKFKTGYNFINQYYKLFFARTSSKNLKIKYLEFKNSILTKEKISIQNYLWKKENYINIQRIFEKDYYKNNLILNKKVEALLNIFLLYLKYYNYSNKFIVQLKEKIIKFYNILNKTKNLKYFKKLLKLIRYISTIFVILSKNIKKNSHVINTTISKNNVNIFNIRNIKICLLKNFINNIKNVILNNNTHYSYFKSYNLLVLFKNILFKKIIYTKMFDIVLKNKNFNIFSYYIQTHVKHSLVSNNLHVSDNLINANSYIKNQYSIKNNIVKKINVLFNRKINSSVNENNFFFTTYIQTIFKFLMYKFNKITILKYYLSKKQKIIKNKITIFIFKNLYKKTQNNWILLDNNKKEYDFNFYKKKITKQCKLLTLNKNSYNNKTLKLNRSRLFYQMYILNTIKIKFLLKKKKLSTNLKNIKNLKILYINWKNKMKNKLWLLYIYMNYNLSNKYKSKLIFHIYNNFLLSFIKINIFTFSLIPYNSYNFKYQYSKIESLKIMRNNINIQSFDLFFISKIVGRLFYSQRHSIYVSITTKRNNSYLALSNVYGQFLVKGSAGLLDFDVKKYRPKGQPKPKKKGKETEEKVVARSDHYTEDFKEAAKVSKKYLEEFALLNDIVLKKDSTYDDLTSDQLIKWDEFVAAKELKHRNFKATPSKSRGFLNRSNAMLQQLAFQLYGHFKWRFNKKFRKKKRYYKLIVFYINTLRSKWTNIEKAFPSVKTSEWLTNVTINWNKKKIYRVCKTTYIKKIKSKNLYFLKGIMRKSYPYGHPNTSPYGLRSKRNKYSRYRRFKR